ncbi:metalloprotease TIKI homolog isoform X2 [Xenia sp. Carnegie-2017]|uniref:metalloprotease TIKI homolog isoform X2 n=1 Tax=Xenia sp. Carnegie-2017 TaxID=2897299 RepID=UPI001F03D397|nr:metalloprotease TIKI homolog isoform X2 [Xenia sp. Carnegie-2017]
MAISESLLLWLLLSNLEDDFQLPQNQRKRSLGENLESYPHHVGNVSELNSFLWVMERDPPVYFFGTIHVPYTKVWDYIPPNSKQAFEKANNVYFELDLTDRDTIEALQHCKSLPHGQKLRDRIPSKLFRRLKAHFSFVRRKISEWISEESKLIAVNPLDLYRKLTKNWRRKRPIWIMLLLDKLNKFNVKMLAERLPVLDAYLMRQAQTRGKKLGSIETAKEQCNVLKRLNKKKVIYALKKSLTLHENIRRGEENIPLSAKQLIHYYKFGGLRKVLSALQSSGVSNLRNISQLQNLEINKSKRFQKYMKNKLFFERNKRMAKRIRKIIKKNCGRSHFIGHKSVISLLRRRGYKIKHLKANDAISLRNHGSVKVVRCKHQREEKQQKSNLKQVNRRKNVFGNLKENNANTTRKIKPANITLYKSSHEKFTGQTSSNAVSLNINRWLCIFLLLKLFFFLHDSVTTIE